MAARLDREPVDDADRSTHDQSRRAVHDEPARRQRAAGGERFEFVGGRLGGGRIGLEQHGSRQQFDGVRQRLDGDRRRLDRIGQQLDGDRHGQQRRRPLERRRGRLGGFAATGRQRRGGHAGHRCGEREPAECGVEPVHAVAEHGQQPDLADAAADPADRFDGA
ncbi:hypothetical protein SB769_28915 [Burkholderia sp. SIMBA_024]